jgi:hypothetical protein
MATDGVRSGREAILAEIDGSLELLAESLHEYVGLPNEIVGPETFSDGIATEAVIELTHALNVGISRAEHHLLQAYRAARSVLRALDSPGDAEQLDTALASFRTLVAVVEGDLQDLIVPRYQLEHLVSDSTMRVLMIELELNLAERLVVHALNEGYTLGEIGTALDKNQQWIRSQWLSALAKLQI